MMKLFFAPECPFAQRACAAMTLLGEKFEPHEFDLANKPPEFLKLSPTGAVPLLEDNGFVLYESAIITEYLAERLTWKKAFSEDPQQRARERLAMKQFDSVIVPAAFASFRDPASLEAKPQWKKELEQLALTAKKSDVESLLGIHLATHWVRWTWAFPDSLLIQAMRMAMGEYLDAAAAMPCVTETNPERAATAAMIIAKFGPPQQTRV